MKKLLLAMLLVVAPVCHAHAQSVIPQQPVPMSEIPSYVLEGFKTYKTVSAEEAVKVWVKGSPMDGSRDALDKINTLQTAQDTYGNYEGFEAIVARDAGSRVRKIYFVLHYQRGPLFGQFTSYKTENGWVLTSFDFNLQYVPIFEDVNYR